MSSTSSTSSTSGISSSAGLLRRRHPPARSPRAHRARRRARPPRPRPPLLPPAPRRARQRRGAAVLLEVRAGIGFAGIGRDDRILVQIVELLAGLGVFALGSADVFGQRCLPSCRENAGPPAVVRPVRGKAVPCQTQKRRKRGSERPLPAYVACLRICVGRAPNASPRRVLQQRQMADKPAPAIPLSAARSPWLRGSIKVPGRPRRLAAGADPGGTGARAKRSSNG